MRFNILKKSNPGGTNTLNLAGGQAFSETSRLELASLMLTSMLKDQFYRTADNTVTRLRELIAGMPDKRFAAKAAIYARREAGMRSVTHLTAAEVARSVKGEPWTKAFYEKVVRRPDDALEVLACYIGSYGRPIPNSLKKGLGLALAGFDAYQLAKYRKQDADLSLVDAVNLLHPPHTPALAALIKGELKPAETWETKLTQAGQQAENDAELSDLKKDAWAGLVRSRKIGYFALLRNLRNILTDAPEVTAEAVAMLTDEKLIRQSLVLPFRFQTALDAVQAAGLPRASEVLAALSDAVDLSLVNVPKFEGRTLVALDTSGSMAGRPIQVGSLFAATLVKANGADFLQFSDDASYLALNSRDSTLTLAKFIAGNAKCAGTDFHSIFRKARGPYDRIIILSDMQGWIGGHAPVQTFAQWKQQYGCDPKVFSFDLQGYGTLQFPEKRIVCLAGFSDKTMDLLRMLDSDPQALIRAIEAVSL